MANTETPIYGCGQQDLYSASQLGWDFCSEHLPDFSVLKAKYTMAYIDQNLQILNTAENLPDAPNRQQRRSTLKVKLTNKTNECVGLWQTLKNYIVEAYPEDLHKAQLNAAGASYYPKAATYNWSALTSLLKTGNLFIDKNLADLVAHDNMPKDFQITFQTAKDTCATLVKEYLAAESIKAQGATEKIKANNIVYSALTAMCKDGQRCFANTEEMKKLFTIENLLNLAGRGGVAGLRGQFTDQATSLPLAGVLITTEEGRYKTLSKKDGRYLIGRMEAGTYTFFISKKGYLPITQTITIKKKTRGTLDQILAQTMLSSVAA